MIEFTAMIWSVFIGYIVINAACWLYDEIDSKLKWNGVDNEKSEEYNK